MNPQQTTPTTFPQPYVIPNPNPNDDVSPHHNIPPHSSSSTSSVVIVMIILSSAIILTATIYFVIRYITRRFNHTSASVNDVNVNLNNEHVPHDSHHVTDNDVDSLPLFKFSSLTGSMISGDCAVCLSKFESEDQLRLLPLCCHAFHALCIDAWLKSNFTCPLCRSNVNPSEADISRATGGDSRSDSFRIEIGSISNRREPSDSRRRSYSVGSFEYVVDIDGYEVSVESTRRRGESDGDKDGAAGVVVGPGENVAAEVGSGRGNWLRRSLRGSLRGSGRLFSTGSSRRSENVVDERIGEEISEFFRWFSGV